MIPHSENDRTVFEVNVLIVHFTSHSSTSGTLHQRRHACSAVFEQLEKKEALWRVTLRNPVLEVVVIFKFNWGCARIKVRELSFGVTREQKNVTAVSNSILNFSMRLTCY